MTYRQEMARLAGELGKLLIEGGRVPEFDIPYALAGHAAVLQLLTTVHQDLAVRLRTGIADLEQQLANQPLFVNMAPYFSRPGPTAVETGERWRNVAESATKAEQEWRLSTTESRPTGRAAWAEMADVSYLAEAVGLLNAEIADSLAEACNWSDASAFRAGQSGLLETARQIQRLTASDPLPTRVDLEPLDTDEIVTISSQEMLPKALKRLPHLVLNSYDLPPGQLDLITYVTAETAKLTASSLGEISSAATNALQEQARRLSAAVGISRHLVPVRLGDGKAVAQAQRIRHFLIGLYRRGATLSPPVAHEAALALAPITQALTVTATEQVTSGLWMILREENETPRLSLSQNPNNRPHLLAVLDHAQEHGDALNNALGQAPTETVPQPPPAPRKILAAPLALHVPTAAVSVPPRTGPPHRP